MVQINYWDDIKEEVNEEELTLAQKVVEHVLIQEGCPYECEVNLTMTDNDIELYIKLGVTRAYPNVTDFSELPSGSDYPIILLAKIELYTKLAVSVADGVDMGADNNNYLKQSQKFNHYMKLVDSAKAQYENWLDNEGFDGGQGVRSFDVLLDRRHYSQRNFEKQSTPKVSLKIDEVTTDSVKFRWGVENTSHFNRFKVYISKKPIIDIYREGYTYQSKLCEGFKLLVSTTNIRNVFHEVKNLEANTEYYLAVVSIERNQVFGFKEVSFTTLYLLPDEEEVIIDTM